MATAKYESEDVQVIFEGDWMKNDYGVRGSTFYEIDEDSVTIKSITILGDDYSESELPPAMKASVWALLSEVEFE